MSCLSSLDCNESEIFELDYFDIVVKKYNTKWYKLISDCQIEDRPLKNCRHTFAVQAIKSGDFTLQQIADILGHANLRMLIGHYADYIDGNARNVNPSLNVYKTSGVVYSSVYSGKN